MAAAALSARAKPYPLISTVPHLLSRRSLGHLRRLCTDSLSSLDPNPDPSPEPLVSVPGRKILETFRDQFDVGNRTVSIETGKIARFANGAVVITMDETNVLSTVASSKTDGSRDFLPLTA